MWEDLRRIYEEEMTSLILSHFVLHVARTQNICVGHPGSGFRPSLSPVQSRHLNSVFRKIFLFAVLLAWWDELCISEVLCMIRETVVDTYSQTFSLVTCWVGLTSLSREKPGFLNSFFKKLARNIEIFHFWKA